MDVPADQSTRAVAQRPPPGTVRRARRRRPTGAAPPLPHHVQTSGVGWLIASVVLVALSAVVFARGLRGLAVDVTVADDARSEEHTSELQSRPHLVCRLL